MINKRNYHTGGDFFYFLQVMFETSFLSFSESALNADSISTKITDFAENFQISDIDGRPNLKAIPSQTSPFYSLHDDDYKNTILDPFTHSQDTIFTNSQKSESISLTYS